MAPRHQINGSTNSSQQVTVFDALEVPHVANTETFDAVVVSMFTVANAAAGIGVGVAYADTEVPR